MQQGGLLPPEYHQEGYLIKYPSANCDPYVTIDLQVNMGDIVEFGVKRIAGTSEQGFAGTTTTYELYYQASSESILNCWPSGNIEKISASYGDVDTITARIKTSNTFHAFGIYKIGTYQFIGNLYYLKVKDTNDNYKINLIPCYRKADKEAGFYDTVGKTFYANQGTGRFFAPSLNMIPQFDDTDFWDDGYINSSGAFVSNNAYRASANYIPIIADQYYTIGAANQLFKGIAYYDSNYQFINYIESQNTCVSYKASSSAKYAKIYFMASSVSVLMSQGSI